MSSRYTTDIDLARRLEAREVVFFVIYAFFTKIVLMPPVSWNYDMQCYPSTVQRSSYTQLFQRKELFKKIAVKVCVTGHYC